MRRSKVVLLACLILASGCVTDELAVFDGNVLTDEEMKPFIGMYEVVAMAEDDGQGRSSEEFKGVSLEISKKGDAYHFLYKERNSQSSGPFVLSKIPGSKDKLLLFASSKTKSTGQSPITIDNIFFVVKRAKDTVNLWLIVDKEPVAKDYPFTKSASGGLFKAKEIKQFLEKHADEFVAENPARITFKKTE
jgi:hypothetical protein